MLVDKFAGFKVKHDKGKTPLIALRCADNRQALLVDARILGVTDFEFDLEVKGVVHATFTVNTVYGNLKAEREVNI